MPLYRSVDNLCMELFNGSCAVGFLDLALRINALSALSVSDASSAESQFDAVISTVKPRVEAKWGEGYQKSF